MIIKNLIFLGAPGAGKGSVASSISKMLPIKHISTGDIFREEIKNETPLGIELKNIVESGLYVPDSTTNKIVANKLSNLQALNQQFMLDGYPRTLDQAKFLDSVEVEIPTVVLLDVPQDVIVSRLSKRRSCPTCNSIYHLEYNPSKKGELCEKDDTVLVQRKDDEPQAIIKRLEVYETQTKPLIEYYKQQNKLKTFDGNKPVQDVVNNILNEVFK